MEMSDQLDAPAALSAGKSPWYPMDRRLGGLQNRSGRGGEEKNSRPLVGSRTVLDAVVKRKIPGPCRDSNPRSSIQLGAQRYTTELSRLLTGRNNSIFRILNWCMFLYASDSFCIYHRVQNGSGAHPASYPMVITDSFPGGKAAGA
jgi:hypothetical protein